MSRRHRIGVIGAGARGEGFSRQLHAGSERAELFGIFDPDEDRLGKFVDYCELKGARTFTDREEFFGSKDLDAVIITVPDFAHRDVALQAIAARKPFYLEKPMAPTTEQCREIIRAQRESGVPCMIGFNLRAVLIYERMKEILDTGILGQLVHIEGLEQLSQAHSASFMRRFHRKKAHTGGILNHKCSHDLDIMQWLVGHEHKVVKIASFAGLDVFVPKKRPAERCSECPRDIYQACPYKDQAGFVFPVHGELPIHKTRDLDTYGGDLCVYTEDKDTFDNQTVIIEWDNGVRGNFNLQLFQRGGKRETRIWGEKGVLSMGRTGRKIQVVMSDTGEVIEYEIQPQRGGHGGSDPKMIGRLIDTIEGHGPKDSGLSEGLAATLMAEKALESALTGKVVTVSPDEYM